jgi:hypothetical protein
MRRPRMTTRRWTMAVAIIALILAFGLCWKRRAAYLHLADRHARSARFWDVHRQRYLDGKIPMFNLEFFDSDDTIKEPYGREFARFSKHYAALERKYSYAAAHPWLSVEADPPEP